MRRSILALLALLLTCLGLSLAFLDNRPGGAPSSLDLPKPESKADEDLALPRLIRSPTPSTLRSRDEERTLHGRVVITEGEAEPSTLSATLLTLERCDSQIAIEARSLLGSRAVPRGTAGRLRALDSLNAEPDGTFCFRGLEPGLYKIRVVHSRYYQYGISGSEAIDLRDQRGQETIVYLALSGALAGRLEPACTAVLGRSVQIRSDDGCRADVKESGEFRIHGLRPGLRMLQIMGQTRSFTRDILIPRGLTAHVVIGAPNALHVRGVIRDREGRPIAGSSVALRSPREKTSPERDSAIADGNGRYQINCLVSDGLLQLTASARGFTAVTQDLATRGGHEPIQSQVDFTLHEGTCVRGRVVGLQGEPVKEAMVRVENSEWLLTQDDGLFLLDGIPAGERMIFVCAKGFAPASKRVRVGTEDMVVADIELGEGRIIEGTVLSESEEPISLARIETEGFSDALPAVLSDSQGMFGVRIDPSATAQLVVSALNFSTVKLDVPPNERGPLHISLRQQGELRGRVSNRNDQRAIQDFIVYAAREGDGHAQQVPPDEFASRAIPIHDERGLFVIPGLSLDGMFSVQVQAEGYAPKILDHVVPQVVRAGVLSEAIEIQLLPSSELRGIVTQEQGRPVEAATVSALVGLDFARIPLNWKEHKLDCRTVLTGSDGSFVFSNIANAPHVLVVEATGFPVQVQRNCFPGVEVEIRLQAGGKLFGQVLGFSAADLRDHAMQADVGTLRLPPLCFTDAGEYESPPLPPGNFFASVIRICDSAAIITKVGTLAKGEEQRLDFGGGEGCIELSGRVLTNGGPATGRTIECYQDGVQSARTTTDSAGRFCLAGFTMGSAKIRIRPEYRVETVWLQPPVTEITLDLSSYCIRGYVKDGGGGRVLGGAHVTVHRSGGMAALEDDVGAIESLNLEQTNVAGALCDNEGYFVVQGLQPGIYALTVAYQMPEARKTIRGYSKGIELSVADPTANVVVECGGRASAEVFVVRNETTEPIPHARVAIYAEGSPIPVRSLRVTDGNGQIQIDNLLPGTYCARADAPGFQVSESVEFRAPGELVTLRLKPGPRLRAIVSGIPGSHNGRLVLVIRREDEGGPLVHRLGGAARFVAMDLNFIGGADSDADAWIDGVAEGSWKLSASVFLMPKSGSLRDVRHYHPILEERRDMTVPKEGIAPLYMRIQ